MELMRNVHTGEISESAHSQLPWCSLGLGWTKWVPDAVASDTDYVRILEAGRVVHVITRGGDTWVEKWGANDWEEAGDDTVLYYKPHHPTADNTPFFVAAGGGGMKNDLISEEVRACAAPPRKELSSHQLARILLNHQDLPVATHANNHTATGGYINVGFLSSREGEQVVIGNYRRPDLNYPNEFVTKTLYSEWGVKEMIKFREHRGSLADSMETLTYCADRNGLIGCIRRLLGEWVTGNFDAGLLRIEKYGEGIDDRNGWDTYVVTYDGFGVVGFTDGAVEEWK